MELPTQKPKPNQKNSSSSPNRESQPKAAAAHHRRAMAAAAVTPGGTGGTAAATSRFAAACGALSHYVKQAAEAERKHARPAAVPVRPLPLMPGADVSDYCSRDGGLDHLAQAAQMMTIVYGGRVLVLDDVPADKAAGLLRLAAAATGAAAAQEGAGTEATGGAMRGGGQVSAAADLPVARKASLQRFMEKRKVRVAAARTEPYRRPDASDAYCPDHLKLAL
ncbi:hypothetical protein BDA96_01G275200 [Sorghum bicolor]|uniref:Protein TIFY n=2 Tax=Sorghum bicolor TaxID=4558 RepID=A0A921UZ12_SORBI|nr:protein TIFY 11e [Sorghum bicolor]KAG0549672.1 hypothetical protein BDA96_01G275200 [Sorghum bicolor]KXG38627.1 hypothetical protein SORBI_3001G259700 [Sorghum bicolor]|eukprot:XP_002464689.2 protein TIFY 11e [Sorghum bicolor]